MSLVSDGKTLKDEHGRLLAEWVGDGLRLYPNLFGYEKPWPLNEAADLTAFIQAGPPKRKWRITRTFEKRPVGVGYDDGIYNSLTDADLEEVWE